MVMTEKEMDQTAEAWLDDRLGGCAQNIYRKFKVELPIDIKDSLNHKNIKEIRSLSIIKKSLCDCGVKHLNETLYMIPKGKNAQTRKIFIKMRNKFENMKNKGELTNCTQKLIPIKD